MNVIFKSAGQVHEVGTAVRIGHSGPVYTVHAVEFIERGSSRFDFYRVTDSAGTVHPHRFVRADLRPVR